MNDQELNQAIESEEGLFDDFAEEVNEPSEVEESEVEEDTPIETTTDEPTNETFLDIDYLKEVKHLSKDEAKVLAQKGMDYDRIKEKYEGYKQYDNSIKVLDKLARSNNMNVNDFVNNLSNMQSQFETNKRLQELKKENPDTDEAILERLAKAEVGKVQIENATKKDPTQERLEAQVKEFEREYPNVDWSNLPDEVIDHMNNGNSMLEAYQRYDIANMQKQIDELKSKVQIKEKNDINKRKSIGNMVSGSEESGDDFLSGFLNA